MYLSQHTGMGALSLDDLANPSGSGEGSIPGAASVSSSDASGLTDYLNYQALLNQTTPGYMLPSKQASTVINPMWLVGGAGLVLLVVLLGGRRR